MEKLGANICDMANLNYTIYPTNNKPTSLVFSKFGLSFKASCVNSLFSDGVGACGSSDQKWGSYNQTIDLTGFSPGNYTIEAWMDYSGSNFSSTGCETKQIINNNNTTFKATFTINEPNTSQLLFAYDNEGNQVSRTYSITELENYVCSNSFIQIENLTGGGVDNLESKVTIAPSPVFTTFKVIWLAELVGQISTVSIQSFNNFYSETLPVNATQTEQSFDLTSRASSIYFIKITLKDGRVINKTVQKL